MTTNAIAQTDQQPAPAALKQDKTPRIPPKVKHACELLADGKVKTISAAAERVNLSREHLSKMLSRPHIRAFFARRAAENIDRAQLRASVRLVELIDAQSEHVAAKVSERILENAGVLKPQSAGGSVNVSIHNNIAPGYVIDLTPPAGAPSGDGARTIEIETVHGRAADRAEAVERG